ncbi:hypothetical protein [Gemella haemolysans]|uniref:hypothetical protein n=1 Tax=Gemella haemolysans TaxID=1379 RepID=UPI001958E8C4|nr:hypothetical protein [Gemella haemolysans]VTX82491.1 Uncharacterised protein [Gemella haemolysans]
MMKLLTMFKFTNLDNQDEVYEGGVISILLAIGRHLWLGLTNIVKALGYAYYLLIWLIYVVAVIVGVGFIFYYLYLVGSTLF